MPCKWNFSKRVPGISICLLSLQGSTLVYSILKLSTVQLPALNGLFIFQHWHCLIYSNGCPSVSPITVLIVERPLSHPQARPEVYKKQAG